MLNTRIELYTIGGRSIGMMIENRMRSGPAPHTWAALSSEASDWRRALAQDR